jgi:hypothetical protein
MTIDTRPSWWGEFSIAPGEVSRWRIGPLTLWVERTRREWRFAAQHEHSFREVVEGPCPCAVSDADPANILRFPFHQPGDSVSLQAALADRPVVFRPLQNLSIPPRESITLYLTSPLWVIVSAGVTPVRLGDFPLQRLQDTWFGAPVNPDGLAYAAGTPAATERTSFSLPLHALTPLLIRNVSDATLPVARLNLPLPLLALFQGADGRLWTEGVTLERSGTDDNLASLRLDRGAPAEAGTATLIAPPRRIGERNLVFEAFGRLFS